MQGKKKNDDGHWTAFIRLEWGTGTMAEESNLGEEACPYMVTIVAIYHVVLIRGGHGKSQNMNATIAIYHGGGCRDLGRQLGGD